jgi:hypothetical protein
VLLSQEQVHLTVVLVDDVMIGSMTVGSLKTYFLGYCDLSRTASAKSSVHVEH